jgi:DNA-binding transcriptional MerR regulator
MYRTYSTFEVTQLAGITERKLQWWREHGLVRCNQNGHNLRYSRIEATCICVIATLRGKGMRPIEIKRLVPVIRRGIANCIKAGDKTVLAVLGDTLTLHLSIEKALARALAENRVRVVDVGSILARIDKFETSKGLDYESVRVTPCVFQRSPC